MKRPVVAVAILLLVIGVTSYTFISAGQRVVTAPPDGSPPFKVDASSSSSDAVSRQTDSQGAVDASSEISSLITQAQESRENFRRLAEGQISELQIIEQAKGDDLEKEAKIKLLYADGSVLTGHVGFASYNGKWMIAKATNDKSLNIPESPAALGEDEAEMGAKMLNYQGTADSQEYITEMMSGRIKSIRLLSVQPGDNSVVLNAACDYTNGKTANAKITLEQLNGNWYITEADKI